MSIFGAPNIEKLRSKKAVDKLARILNHSDRNLAKQAAQALKELGWKPVPEENEVAFYFALQEWRSLNGLSQKGLSRMIRSLTEKGPDIQKEVLEAFGAVKDVRVAPDLIDIVGRSKELDPLIEQALTRIGKGAGKALIEILSKKDRWDHHLKDKQILSTQILYKIKYDEDVDLLIDAWHHEIKKRLEGYTAAVAWAIKLNRLLSTKSRFNPLIEKLEKIDMASQYLVRQGIVQALWSQDKTQTQSVFQEALKDESKEVRESASLGFGHITSPKVEIDRYCDICSIGLKDDKDEIHLLTTLQIVSNPEYWKEAFSRLDAIIQEDVVVRGFDHNSEKMAMMIAARKEPWLVCGKCIDLFPKDHSKTKEDYSRWISSGGKELPSGPGYVIYAVNTGDSLLNDRVKGIR